MLYGTMITLLDMTTHAVNMVLVFVTAMKHRISHNSRRSIVDSVFEGLGLWV